MFNLVWYGQKFHDNGNSMAANEVFDVINGCSMLHEWCIIYFALSPR